jgi:tRNA A37 threonylcarbamoyladenosine dehydratase
VINPAFQRLALLTGEDGLQRLSGTKVIVFGLGGVGSWCAEALVRSGIGSVSLVDSDTVCVTNINRQAQATQKTIGQFKADALKNRLCEINPACAIKVFNKVFSKESADDFDIADYDFVIDAIDSLENKLTLIESCGALNVICFSSMGMALKLDPSQIRIADIWETSGCALARLVRAGLRKRGRTGPLTVVYSRERLPLQTAIPVSCGGARCLCPKNSTDGERKEWCSSKKVINGNAVTVTATAGMMLASLVIRQAWASAG